MIILHFLRNTILIFDMDEFTNWKITHTKLVKYVKTKFTSVFFY